MKKKHRKKEEEVLLASCCFCYNNIPSFNGWAAANVEKTRGSLKKSHRFPYIFISKQIIFKYDIKTQNIEYVSQNFCFHPSYIIDYKKKKTEPSDRI